MRLNFVRLRSASSSVFGLLAAMAACSALAELDLRNASVDHLDNGLTVIILEDQNFPVVSVQMLYRIGARDEVTGKTGLAHFVEHMAFRDSENFPDTGLASSVYAVGGEWHGYTWTDQTTYFATAPKEHLDLLLRIEADRMSRLTIAPKNIEPERGAVLAEMHMYENAPSSMLIDALMFTSFLAHPYRNNTIGWESDIDNLQHQDVVDFYKKHYYPANGVLAIVGDIDRARTMARVDELFGDFAGKEPTPLPVTIEPPQDGERRITLHGDTNARQFVIGYRAPSVSHPDFATFLVLQELLGGGSGVSFLQNDWGAPVRDESLLAGAADDLTTWFPPSAQDYIFVIGGSADGRFSESAIEKEIEDRVAMARQRLVHESTLSDAISRSLDELVFDVETTEDAAHQLASFDGLHALDKLMTLPQQIAAVTATEVQRVANTWLKPERRTIAWYLPRETAKEDTATTPAATINETDAMPLRSVDYEPSPPPSVRRLGGGIPVIVQPSDLSSSIQLQIVFRGHVEGAPGVSSDSPVNAHSSIAFRRRSGQLDDAIGKALESVRELTVVNSGIDTASTDPETRLKQTFDDYMRARDSAPHGSTIPKLIIVSGDVNSDTVVEALEQAFGVFEAASLDVPQIGRVGSGETSVRLGIPVAQAQLGYIVSAPGPNESAYEAVRILQYILSHGYEGRLGKEAITRRGLAYYIDSRYRSDGTNGWVTLGIGVDPQKVGALKLLLLQELQRLHDEPPTAAEIDEAKAYFLGRGQSAAQSNEELAKALARQWLWHGDVRINESLERRLAATSHRDVLDAIPAFIDGLTIVVAE